MGFDLGLLHTPEARFQLHHSLESMAFDSGCGRFEKADLRYRYPAFLFSTKYRRAPERQYRRRLGLTVYPFRSTSDDSDHLNGSMTRR